MNSSWHEAFRFCKAHPVLSAWHSVIEHLSCNSLSSGPLSPRQGGLGHELPPLEACQENVRLEVAIRFCPDFTDI